MKKREKNEKNQQQQQITITLKTEKRRRKRIVTILDAFIEISRYVAQAERCYYT